MKAYTADQIFTGEEWITDQAVLVDENIILDIIPKENIPPGAELIYRSNAFLAPAFIDVQIYGANGFLFSQYPSPDTLQEIYQYCKNGGAFNFQPTVATNSYEVFFKCIDAVKEYWRRGGEGVLGLHVEGPWISKAKRGAHIEAFIHSPTVEQARTLLEYGKGVITMITLAPEVCSKEVIELIKSYGVIISAGHSNATLSQANDGFALGIPAATHLYNAMSPLLHRAPGMVGAVLNHSTIMSSIVPDGFHVDFAAISIAKKAMKERLFFITDAVTETKEGPYQHQLEGDKYSSDGILSGSALTMAKGVKNGVEKAGIELSEALKMAGFYPAQVMRTENRLGKIKKDYQAAVIFMNKELEIV